MLSAATSSRAPAPFTGQTPTRWYKGNTHTHTLESDGDSTPAEVTRWYREHGYQFLVLSDHNVLTAIDALNTTYGAPEEFVLIRGEEVTSRFETKALHVNALDIAEVIAPRTGSSVRDVLQGNVDAIRAARGVPHINHPNFTWAVAADTLRQIRGNRLLEIFNGHPQVNNLGGGGIPGAEEAWDAILSSGTLMFGIAVDDAHTFKKPGDPTVAGPGRGWVVVRAPRLEPRVIVEAIDRGDFYSSTGVTLEDVVSDGKTLTVSVKKDAWAKYRVQFIGAGGRVLQESIDSPASYTFRGNEGYVRAKVIESNGRIAWCQPVMVRR